jgi:hypothetical protein
MRVIGKIHLRMPARVGRAPKTTNKGISWHNIHTAYIRNGLDSLRYSRCYYESCLPKLEPALSGEVCSFQTLIIGDRGYYI